MASGKSDVFGTGPVVAVLVGTFFLGFGGGVVFPILPDLGAVVGTVPVVVGIILSANRVVRLRANAPVGTVVDRVGTRTPFIAGVVIETVATVGYLIALHSSVPAAWFLSARVLWVSGARSCWRPPAPSRPTSASPNREGGR